jgi:TPR repeat protein
LTGEGVSKSLTEAAKYLKMSADQGDLEAQFRFGLCLRLGEGVTRDEERALSYFKMSVDRNNVLGQVAFGLCLREHNRQRTFSSLQLIRETR